MTTLHQRLTTRLAAQYLSVQRLVVLGGLFLGLTAGAGLGSLTPAAANESAPTETAATDTDIRVGSSGLPVPRYVSFGVQEVNMRSGPGTRYPIKWVYGRKSLPVRVEAEFDIWRKVRDHDGETGWVHGSLLSGRRTVLIVGEPATRTQTLRHKPDATSAGVLRAEDGVIAELLVCEKGWCRLRLEGKKGWVPRSGLWGLLDHEGQG